MVARTDPPPQALVGPAHRRRVASMAWARRWAVVMLLILSAVRLNAATPGGVAGPRVERRTAATHPMQYLISRPVNWTPSRTWPVVVVIEDAHREFAATADAFVRARGNAPFVLVVPIVLGGGGTAQSHPEVFPYRDADWSRAARDGNCAFDDDGLAAVLADVGRLDAARPRPYLTGFEAGGHVVWAQVFRHPERWRGAVLIGPNFLARCLDDASYSSDSTRASLWIRVLHGAADPRWAKSPLADQTRRAIEQARAHGFRDVSERAVAGRVHEPLPAEVMREIATRAGR